VKKDLAVEKGLPDRFFFRDKVGLGRIGGQEKS
jgi:hypothetical protein